MLSAVQQKTKFSNNTSAFHKELMLSVLQR